MSGSIFHATAEIEDSEFQSDLNNLQGEVEEKTGEMSQDVQQINDGVDITRRNVTKTSHESLAIINFIFQSAGISLGAFGPILQAASTVVSAAAALGAVDVSTGWGTFQGVMIVAATAIALIKIAEAQNKTDKATEDLNDAIIKANMGFRL